MADLLKKFKFFKPFKDINDALKSPDKKKSVEEKPVKKKKKKKTMFDFFRKKY